MVEIVAVLFFVALIVFGVGFIMLIIPKIRKRNMTIQKALTFGGFKDR